MSKVIFLCVLVFVSSVEASELAMEKGGCIGCHRVSEKLIGPAFTEVAARYRDVEGAGDYLFQKVREGGEGEWGDKPMLPNSQQKISDENLRAVIAWILGL